MIYKLVVISDVHHNAEGLERILPIINSSDYLIFCGDGLNTLMSMRDRILVPMVCVKGNCDYDSNMSDSASIVLGNTRVLVTHGHRQHAQQSIKGILDMAKYKNCSLAFFGHTHTFYDYTINDIHCINPGALCLGSYALVVGDGANFSCKQQMV